jgi:hypothetical protein
MTSLISEKQSTSPPKIYRLALENRASAAEYRAYRTKLKKLKENQSLLVTPDHPRPNELEAYTIIRIVPGVEEIRGAYIVSTIFERAFLGGYRARPKSRLSRRRA